ncbi:MAG TPA: DUF1992 domain-containing protein [Acidimicrobiia bacterium]|nr:DUF1992 domain-containing protein [Acidimicrobiia bacterium]
MLFVERIIEEAIARGEFDNLPGEGQPLSTGDDGPGWWIRNYVERMRRGAGDRLLLPAERSVVGNDVDPGESGRDH